MSKIDKIVALVVSDAQLLLDKDLDFTVTTDEVNRQISEIDVHLCTLSSVLACNVVKVSQAEDIMDKYSLLKFRRTSCKLHLQFFNKP